MKVPAEGWGEENAKVAEGGRGAEDERGIVRVGNGEGGGYGATAGGAATRGVEEHEFCFVDIGDEAVGLEPCENLGNCARKVHSCHMVGGTRGINGAIVNVEGEVLPFPLSGFVKKQSGEEGGEDG